MGGRTDVPFVRVNLGTIPALTALGDFYSQDIEAATLVARERDLVPTKDWRRRSGGPKPGGALRGKITGAAGVFTSSANIPDIHLVIYPSADRTSVLFTSEFIETATTHWVQVGTGGTTFMFAAHDWNIPHLDLDGTGKFHVDFVLDNHTNPPLRSLPAGVLSAQMFFVPEYPA